MNHEFDIRHAEAFAHETRAAWIASLWVAMALLAVLSAFFGN